MTTKTLPLSGPINLMGRIGRGSFTVAARDGVTEATVTLAARVADSDILERTTVELRGPTLVVSAPRQGGIFDLIGRNSERDAIDVSVVVPSGTAMKISTFTADVTVTGRSGSADIACGSSSITVEHIDGDLRLRYGNGTARVDRVSGSVEARSGSGNASFGDVGGSLTSACGSGNLSASAVHGRVRSRAGSGTASIGAVYGDVDLASGSGGLTIGVPAGTTARLDATTGSGEVQSELSIDDAPRNKGRAISVRARTGSGDVKLIRAA
jgi:DUF4097 and DUF4098 domain-containing protein YvlB